MYLSADYAIRRRINFTVTIVIADNVSSIGLLSLLSMVYKAWHKSFIINSLQAPACGKL